jgi:putative ABC transport system substrate-binding protein
VREANQGLLVAFRDGLSALGWINGTNIAVLDRWAEDRTERLPGLIKEMAGSGVVVLVTAGTAATLAAKRAITAIPIVLVAVDDPVAIGVVDSLAKPGGNTTGLCLTSSEMIAKRLQLLQELVLGLHRLGVIVRNDPGLEQKLQDIRGIAARMGITRSWRSRRRRGGPSNSPSGCCGASAARPSMWPPARWVLPSVPRSSRSPQKLACP